jgi:hypothetical protein
VLFTAHGLGFVIVTPRTAIFGNEIGIRRCLDRIAEGRIADDMPAWVQQLANTPGAAYSIGIDLQAGPVATAVAQRLPFLHGATLARGVGNFDPPGLHLAGTITHAEAEQARSSVQGLLAAGNGVNVWGRLLGLGQPIHKLEAQSAGLDNRFVLAVDASSIETLMTRFLPPAPTRSSGPGYAAGGHALRDGATPGGTR